MNYRRDDRCLISGYACGEEKSCNTCFLGAAETRLVELGAKRPPSSLGPLEPSLPRESVAAAAALIYDPEPTRAELRKRIRNNRLAAQRQGNRLSGIARWKQEPPSE